MIEELSLSPDEIIELKAQGFGDLLKVIEKPKNENLLENSEQIFSGQKMLNFDRNPSKLSLKSSSTKSPVKY